MKASAKRTIGSGQPAAAQRALSKAAGGSAPPRRSAAPIAAALGGAAIGRGRAGAGADTAHETILAQYNFWQPTFLFVVVL